ncbi:MAG: DNA gyrase/topoisomerase IV subunit A, partial [Bacteroidota bacterium]
VLRLNTEGRGKYLGSFKADDKILTLMKDGYYRLTNFELTNHFDEDLILIEKFNPKKIVSVVYFDGETKLPYIKRFQIEESDKKLNFIGDHSDSYVYAISNDWLPQVEVVYNEKLNKKKIENEKILLADFIAVKGYKAKGKRVSTHFVKEVLLLDSLPYEEEGEIVNEEDFEEESTENDISTPLELDNNKKSDEDGDDPIQMTLF